MKSQSKCPHIGGPYLEGRPSESGPMSGPGLSKKETHKQKTLTKSGVTGSAYLHSMGAPPGRGGPPDDKRDDESGEEENEEDDTDEETVSVTSSSQVSAGRMRPPQWNVGEENTKGGAGGAPEDPNDPSGGRSAGDGRRGTQGHRGQRGRTGPPGRDGPM